MIFYYSHSSQHLLTYILLLLYFTCYISPCFSEVFEGDRISGGDFRFIGRFCIEDTGWNAGQVEWSVQPRSPGHVLVLFDDQGFSWPAVRSKSTCLEKLSHAVVNGIFPLAVAKGDSMISGMQIIQERAKSRPWYIVIANCNGPVDVDRYNIRMYHPTGSFWTKEFSFSDRTLPEMHLMCLIFLIILIIIQIYASQILKRMNSFHLLVKVVDICTALQLLSFIFWFSADVVLGVTGFQAVYLKISGDFIDLFSLSILTMLFLLVSEGFGITSVYIQNKSFVFTVFITYCVLSFILFVWRELWFDTELYIYRWESLPGLLILLLRTVILCIFVIQINRMATSPISYDKKLFFFSVGIPGAVWLSSLSLVVLCAILVTPCYRPKVVDGVYHLTNYIILCILTYLLWPTRIHRFVVETPDVLYSAATPYDQI